MAEGEQPPSEQAGGSTPPPGLGVPPLGPPSSSSPGTPPPGAGHPEIVEDYYPYVGPQTPQQPAAPKRRVRLTASRMILLVFLVLIVSGAIATQVRHAHATPADKTACSSTLGALSNLNPTTLRAMLHDLEFANDKTLLGARGDMSTDIPTGNATAVGNDLNKVIHRCNQLSDEFKHGFQTFCDSHPGYCKQTFHVGPF